MISTISSGLALLFLLYFAQFAHVVKSQGVIYTVAGNGNTAYSGDNGAATSAAMWFPNAVAVDSSGNLYIADSSNCRVRKVILSTSIITTVVGTGTCSFSGDGGAATSASLYLPYGLGLDSSGNIYVADWYNERIRKVTVSNNVISTIAGSGATGNTGTYSGDNGQATAATFNAPTGVAVDNSGNVYIAESNSHRIRKVTVITGIISTVVGTGVGSFSGDGLQATAATINSPYHVSVDSSANIYVADYGNYRIRKITVSTGIISTIAGSGSFTYGGDGGVATSAGLYAYGVAVDVQG